jgi:hypothetical protein
MKKVSLVLIGLTMVLAGCKEAPAKPSDDTETEESSTTQDSNSPDSYEIMRICKDGTKIYRLVGGAASGRYGVYQGNNEKDYSWVLISSEVRIEDLCSTNN